MQAEPKDVKALFLAAAENAVPGERAAFLDAACAGDAALRQRVEELLRAHDEPADPLERLARELCRADSDSDGSLSSRSDPDTLVPAPEEALGGRVGPSPLLQK